MTKNSAPSIPITAFGAATLHGDSFAATQAVLAKARPILRRNRNFIGADFKPIRMGFRSGQGLDQTVADRISVLASHALADLMGIGAASGLADTGFAIVVVLPEVDPAFDLPMGMGTKLIKIAQQRLAAPVLRQSITRAGSAGPGIAIAQAMSDGWDGLPVVLLAVDSMAARGRLMAQMARGDLLSDVNPYGMIPGEGAVAMLLSQGRSLAQITGAGHATETLREDDDGDSDYSGMSQAWWQALGQGETRVDHLWTDWNNGRYRAAQMSYAMLRSTQRLAADITPEHVSMTFGDTGAAAQLLALGQGLVQAQSQETVLVSAHSRWSGDCSAIVAQRS